MFNVRTNKKFWVLLFGLGIMLILLAAWAMRGSG